MSKYIDAHEAREALSDLLDDMSNNDYSDGVCAAINKLDTLTLVDAEPVRHGHWQLHGHALPSKDWECSECDCLVTQAYYGDVCYYAYCPCCGAKMREQAGDEDS